MFTSRQLITPPMQDVVTLEEAKAQLRVTDDSNNAIIEAVIAATVAQLDPASGGWLGRALRPQTWELRLPSFNTERRCRETDYLHSSSGSRAEIELPYPPITSIVSVKYDDLDGVEQTLIEGSDFRVLNSGGLGKQAIAPLYNQFWPLARWDAETVRIRFTSGYDADENPDPLPAAIKQAIHLGNRAVYSLGERNLFLAGKSIDGVSDTRWVVSAAATQLIKDAADVLLSTYRVW